MAIKPDMLRVFVAVADHGNLADAADALGRTPSAVSMMLKQFQDHLGRPLFESDRKSRLTPLGVFAREQAAQALAVLDAGVGRIEDRARGRSGRVRLAAVPSAAATLLPAAIRRFRQRHPGARVELRDMDSASVLRELVSGRVDLGIATVAAAPAGFHRVELVRDDFGLICRPDHRLAQAGAAVTWAALAPEMLIANGLCAGIAAAPFQALVERAPLAVQNTTSLLALVQAGVGVTVLPRLSLPKTAGLAFLPLAETGATRAIDLIARDGGTALPVVAALAAQIRAAAPGPG